MKKIYTYIKGSVKEGKVEVSPECDLSCKIADAAEPKGAVEVKGDETKFIFFVESISGLKSEEIVQKAIDVIKDKAKEFEKQASAL